jgi:hypothetical protein
MSENWKDIPGFEGYQASTLGRIKGKYGRILKLKLDIGSYQRVTVYIKGKPFNKGVSFLVASAYLPNPDNLPYVCHKDDVRTNNIPDNLFWGTTQDNVDDKVSKGRQMRGTGYPLSKLTESDVEDIRELRKNKLLLKDIAGKYNVSITLIHKVLNSKAWKHV